MIIFSLSDNLSKYISCGWLFLHFCLVLVAIRLRAWLGTFLPIESTQSQFEATILNYLKHFCANSMWCNQVLFSKSTSLQSRLASIGLYIFDEGGQGTEIHPSHAYIFQVNMFFLFLFIFFLLLQIIENNNPLVLSCQWV